MTARKQAPSRSAAGRGAITFGWSNGAYRVLVPVRVPAAIVRRLGDGYRWPQLCPIVAERIAREFGRALRLRVVPL